MKSFAAYAFVLLVGLPLLAGCGPGDAPGNAESGIQGKAEETPVFSYDQTAFPGAKPWTSESFKNDPKNFQFAVLGDRGGGASPLGTYERAIDQLNWMQPEFVMSVGDFVEGYTADPAEMVSTGTSTTTR